MLALLPSVVHQAEEEEALLPQDSSSTKVNETSSIHESTSISETSIGNVSRISVRSGPSMRPRMRLFVLAAVVLLILRALHCTLLAKKVSTSEPTGRRLADGNKGGGEDDEAETGSGCWSVEELLASQEAAGSSAASSEMPPAPAPAATSAAASAEAEADAGETQPRKRKFKRRRDSDESSEKEAKAAKLAATGMLQSPGEPLDPFEGAYSSPSSEAQPSSSYSVDLLSAGLATVSQPFSQPHTGTISGDPSSSQSATRISQELASELSWELSLEEVVTGLLDAESLSLENWFVNPFVALPSALEEGDDLSQVSPEPQPSTSGYTSEMRETREEAQHSGLEAAERQEEQRQSPPPTSPLEGTSRSSLSHQAPSLLSLLTAERSQRQSPPPTSPLEGTSRSSLSHQAPSLLSLLTAERPQRAQQVTPSTSSAAPGDPQHPPHPFLLELPVTASGRRGSHSAGPGLYTLASRGPVLLTREQCNAHPFNILPTTEPGEDLDPFSFVRSAWAARTNFMAGLLPLARLLRQSFLTRADLQSLIHLTESLYHNSSSFLDASHIRTGPVAGLLGWSRRFLVGYFLWRACEVVGPAINKHLWWNMLFTKIVGDPPQPIYQPSEGPRKALARRLLGAVLVFKRGESPAAEDLVPLLREIFTEFTGIPFLRGSEWDPWREDDKAYLESLNLQEEGSTDED